MQATLETIATVRIFVASLSVLVGLYLVTHALRKSNRNKPVPLRASALMASLLILNSVFGLLGVPVTSANTFLIVISIVAIVALLSTLNLLVFRALRDNPPNPTVKRGLNRPGFRDGQGA